MRFYSYGRIILLATILPLLSGCYLLNQGSYLLRYNLGAENIERVLSREDLEPDIRTMLEEVVEIRRFAREELGLAENRNYTRYSRTGEEYLVNVVTACKEDSFTPRTWSFPIVGTVPYKGFYRREDALRLARRLKEKNYDVIVRPVDAFSTLGFFSDPIYDFMRDYSVFDLADLIIHEQTHATLFVKSEIQFNEELATFVGYEGAIRYMASRGDPGDAVRRELEQGAAEREVFLELMRELYAELDEAYRTLPSRGARLAAKEEIISRFQRRIETDYGRYFMTERFRFLSTMELNNAYILSWNIYSRDLSLFEELFEACNEDVSAFMEALKPVERYKGEPKEYVRSLLKEGG